VSQHARAGELAVGVHEVTGEAEMTRDGVQDRCGGLLARTGRERGDAQHDAPAGPAQAHLHHRHLVCTLPHGLRPRRRRRTPPAIWGENRGYAHAMSHATTIRWRGVGPSEVIRMWPLVLERHPEGTRSKEADAPSCRWGAAAVSVPASAARTLPAAS